MAIEVHSSCVELPYNDLKGKYSEYLFSALCTHSKYLCQKEGNDYGVDYRIVQLVDNGEEGNSKYIPGPDLLLFQIKSSVNWSKNNGLIKYKLDNKSYNLMAIRNKNNLNPVILILCCLPDDHVEWLRYHDHTSIKTNFYWYKLGSDDPKENIESKTTIYIPEKQRLKENTLTKLIDKYTVQPVLSKN